MKRTNSISNYINSKEKFEMNNNITSHIYMTIQANILSQTQNTLKVFN